MTGTEFLGYITIIKKLKIMASDKEKREKLVRFLDQKAFNPILKKKESDFHSDNEKSKFKDIKRSTENEKKRFHDNYNTAGEVKDNYLSDLSSETAKRKNRELKQLNLPRLPDFKDEFMKLCDKLEV